MNLKLRSGLVLLVIGFFCACQPDSVATNNSESPPKDTFNERQTSTILPVLTNKENTVEFETVDLSTLGDRFKSFDIAVEPVEIIRQYYPATVFKKNSYEKIVVSHRLVRDTLFIDLLHDNQPHIVLQGHRIEMIYTKMKHQWHILGIKQQFKCWTRQAQEPVWSAYRCTK